MKNFAFLLFFLLVAFQATAQSKNASLTITYKGSPLCYWDVTLKHGDVAIGQGKTDDKGFVDFGSVQLVSTGVDASGYKKTNNGEKKWDVKGYIKLNDQGHADFDFDPLVQDSGMPSMMESAWGLTLNDCKSGSTVSNTSSEKSTTTGTSTTGTNSTDNGNSNSTESNTTTETVQHDPAQAYADQKLAYENQIKNIDRKLLKKKEEIAKYESNSAEYQELNFDIQELELEKELTQVKLEKTEKSIARGNLPLNKTDRDYYNQREDEIKAKQDTLKENRKNLKNGKTETEIKNEQVDEKADGNVDEVEEDHTEEIESFDSYTPEQLKEMGTVGLQKLKLEYQTKMAKRNTVLKTRGSTLKPDKRTQIENELVELERMIKLCDEEIASRKDK